MIKQVTNHKVLAHTQSRFFWSLPLLLLLFLSLAGCGRDRATPTPTLSTSSAPQVQLQPTFTPTASVGGGNTAIILGITATPQPNFTATATPLPTTTPQISELLELAHYHHRIGDHATARTNLTNLLNRVGPTDARVPEAQFLLARTYLAEDAHADVIRILAQLKVDNGLVESGIASDGRIVSETVTNTTVVTAAVTSAAVGALVGNGLGAARTDNPSTMLEAKAEFLRAVALANIGEQSQAIAAYWRFLEAYPQMAEFVQPRIANAYLALGNTDGATTSYRRAVDATTERVAKARLLETLANLYVDNRQYTEAIAAYDEILDLAHNPGYRADIQYRAGQALVSAGDLPAAIGRWRAATDEAPASNSAYLALVELVYREVDFDLYLRGYIDLQAGALQPAINAYQAYLDSVGATDSRAGLALAELGRSYLLVENYTAAIDRLEQVIANYPTCTCLGQAWLDLGQSLASQGEIVAAQRTYRTFAREHADDPLAPEALWRSGRMSINLGNRVEAAGDLLRLADAFPASDRAPIALYLVGFGAYEAGFHDQAITLYERLQAEYPTYNWSGVSFWLGRFHQAAGDSTAARAEWQKLVDKAPDIYYGVLAAQALRQLPLVAGNYLNAMSNVVGPPSTLGDDDGSQEFAEQWLANWLDLGITEVGTLETSIANDQDLQAGMLLLELGQRGDGLIALDRVYARYRDQPQALYTLSLLFEEIGAYRLSIVGMSRLLEFSPARLVEDAPIFLQRRAYPRHFAELITQEALSRGLNPLLYFSLIRQESLFEEGARSSASAQGLAQIMPATGQEVAERLRYPNYTNDLVYRPYVNLHFGAFYLAWARDYLSGNLVSALVGYNAGPGYAERSRATIGADDTLFVELLQVNEPRIYVQAITANLYHYTRLYGRET